MELLRLTSVVGFLLILLVCNVRGSPKQTKLIIDLRYEVMCDGGPSSCRDSSQVNNSTEAPNTTTPETTIVTPTPTTEITTTSTPTTTTMSTSTPTPTTTPISTSTTTTGTTTEGPFKCPGTEIYADPKDCHSYYRCQTVDNPIHVKCPILTKYNQDTQGCVFGFC
ncbi:uncharacterized protein DDB_G0290587-like [Periplaneta americana]|uniref:uncharacterized protein DDB_G0290587-like n=1 Tax=Periplaneta americana TaxID=6978 RepID=UPI0037E87571